MTACLSTRIQGAGEWRCYLKATFLREINGGIDIAFSAGQLHALNVLNHLAGL
jgi:hypothetical protein